MTQAQLLRRFFFSRSDIVANFVAAWGKPCPVKVRSESDLMHCLEAHTGNAKHSAEHFTAKGTVGQREIMRLGSYTPNTEGDTVWICIDFDGKGHDKALESPLAIAQLTIDKAIGFGLKPHLERSGGGRGWHVWFFFEHGINATAARSIGMGLVPLNAPLIGGGVADPEHHKAIEVFPKISELSETGLGHMVWLPFWGGAQQGSSAFYDADGESELIIDGFESTDPYVAMEALSKFETVSAKRETRTPVAQLDRRFESADWDDWRHKVYSQIPLKEIFRLTGKSFGNGWLEARTAEGEDKNPSAAVSDGTKAADRGLYHDYTTGETLNVIDYIMRFVHPTESFTEAASWIASTFGFGVPESRRPGTSFEPPPPESPYDYFTQEREEQPTPEQIAKEEESTPDGTAKKERAKVNVKEDERDQILQVWDALNKSTKPIYQWGGIPIYLLRGSAESIDSNWFRYIVSTEVQWFKYGAGGKGKAVMVPEKGASSTIGAALSSIQMFAKELKTVVRCPIYTSDGRLLTEPGYDAASKIYYHRTCDVPPVSEKPSEEEMGKASKLIFSSLLRDFPFEDRRSRAHAFAALITPFVRFLIDGVTPLYVYESPRAGTGKTLLASLVPLIVRGYSAPIMLDPQNSTENKKLLTAALLKEPGGIIFIDNFRGFLGDPFLEAIITSSLFEDRVLGVSKNVRAANLSTFLISSNNPGMNADTHRRAVVSRLDAKVQRPELRDPGTYRIPNLIPWVREHRGSLIWALLTMIQRWLSTGAVHAPVTLGSFENYAGVVGGILQANGIDGFLERRADELSPDDMEWEHFCAYWWERFAGEMVTAAKLIDSMTVHHNDLLASQLAKASTPRGMVSSLGMLLQRRTGQVVRLREVKDCPAVQLQRNGRSWSLIRTEPSDGRTLN